MPDFETVLAAHLAHLRLLGRSERTVYDRERAVIRLAAWLSAARSSCSSRASHSCAAASISGVQSGSGTTVTDTSAQSTPPSYDAVLSATAADLADLAAWLQARESYKNEQPDSVVEVLVQAPGFPEVAPPGTSGRETTLNTAHGGAAGSRSPAPGRRAGREVNRPGPGLLSATHADLAAWRASLTVGEDRKSTRLNSSHQIISY